MKQKWFYSLLITVTVAVWIAFPSWNAVAQLVLYLPFEEAGDPVDRSPDPTKASIKGKLNQVNGKIGKALVFDGKDANYIEVTHSSKLEGMSALTIEVWVNPTKPDATARAIVSKRTAFQQKDLYNLFMWSEVKVWGRVNGNDSKQTSTKTIFADGVWYHLAYVFDGSAAENDRQKMYVNGVLETTQAHPDKSVGKGDTPLFIGLLNAGYGSSWNGTIDELRIWNKALSVDEIKSAMTGAITSVEFQGKLTTKWGEMKKL